MQDIRLFIEIMTGFGCVVLGCYLTRKFDRRPRLIAGTTKAAHIKMKDGQILSNHTLIVKNDGKKEAKNVQIIHLNLPKYYQVLPAISYTVNELKDGKAIIFPTLVPNEEITICYMYPESLFGKIHGVIKHDEGQAKQINILLTREYSISFLRCIRFLIFLGIVTVIYGLLLLVIKGWNFILAFDASV